MFTGIVEGLGKVVSSETKNSHKRLTVDVSILKEGILIGGSLSINGCCTTAIQFENKLFVCELIDTTLQRTNLVDLTHGDLVNLERPVKIGDELSGHIVQGHIDGVGFVKRIEEIEGNYYLSVTCEVKLLKYIVTTGSVAVNGVSLTVADTDTDSFTLGIIPHTWKITNFRYLKTGSKVNIEVDVIGKYVEKLFPDQINRSSGQ